MIPQQHTQASPKPSKTCDRFKPLMASAECVRTTSWPSSRSFKARHVKIIAVGLGKCSRCWAEPVNPTQPGGQEFAQLGPPCLNSYRSLDPAYEMIASDMALLRPSVLYRDPRPARSSGKNLGLEASECLSRISCITDFAQVHRTKLLFEP